MSAIRITNFLGIAPKIASELLPDTAAQIAENVNLFSGNLISYTELKGTGASINTGTVNTVYALRDPSTGDPVFLSWTANIDIAIAASNEDGSQRFYYTGDGSPKVSDYELATDGSAPFPVAGGYYDLGLPLPDTVVTTTATSFTTKTTASFFRDVSSVVTINSTAHGLRTGNSIVVSGFTYLNGSYSQSGSNTVTVTITAHGLSTGDTIPLDFFSGDGITGSYTITTTGTNTFTFNSPVVDTTSGSCGIDLRGLNARNVEVTVIDADSFTYFSPGFPIGSSGTPITYTAGKIDLGGLTQNRTYVYAWFTPWLEESIASEPSDDLFIKEGQQVTVSNLPITGPSGDNFVRGVRLYRTVSSASGTEYFLLSTLWFPNTIARVSRTSQVSRITTDEPHNLDIGDYFKIDSCPTDSGSFDIIGGEVTAVIDDYAFEYSQPGEADVSDTGSSGDLYIDVSQIPGTSPAQYWGDASFDFTDNFDSRLLQQTLETDNYDKPPAGLQGLISFQDNILVGFVANEVYFSEPNFPHAWPIEYKITLEHEVVGLASISGALLVLTEAFPYIIQGTDPAAGLSVQRIDLDFPCLNRRSIVVMYGAVVWATFGGLAVYSPAVGAQLITKYNYNNETWQADVDPATVVAVFYRDKYFASHSQGAFIFERDEKNGGTFVTTDVIASAGWLDSTADRLYLVIGTAGELVEWNDPDEPRQVYRWKSKTFKTQDMINLGAARVIADYNDIDPNALPSSLTWSSVSSDWVATTSVYNFAGLMNFRLYVDKQLIFTRAVEDSGTFRLPTGYRSDTFEVEVESNLRLREIHMAETPLGLKKA